MDIGALWLKETSEGEKYFSGRISFPGTTIDLAIFKNKKKEKDNHPDYRIVWSEPRDEKKPRAESGESPGNGIPF